GPRTACEQLAGKKSGLVVRELVRENHLCNCLLCHSPAFSRVDALRVVIPAPDQPVPPSFSELYHEDNDGIGMVRADVTYLRQDFSAMQPGVNPGNWPKEQRYDFLVRVRPLTPKELARHEQRRKSVKPQPLSDHQQAILFALRELTGKDLGTSAEAWKKLLLDPERGGRR